MKDLPPRNIWGLDRTHRHSSPIVSQAAVDAVLVDCATCGAAFKKEYIDLLKLKGPGVSKGITEKKIKRIRDTGARIVVSGCPGCRTTIGGNMDEKDRIAVLHPMQLLDMALSGKGFDKFVL